MSRQVVLDDELSVRVSDAQQLAAPSANEVQIRVVSAGVNFWEVMQRRGRVPLPPHRVLGSEGVGVVDAVGAGVTAIGVGQRVAWSKVAGSFAATIHAPVDAVVPVPDAVSDDDAAALLFQGATAHYLASDTWPVNEGDDVVVTAAAGGVGVLLTQLLVARGARVIGAVSSAAKAHVAQTAGAADVVLYGESLAEQVQTLAPAGVAAVFDAIGAGVAEPLLRSLRARGGMILYGAASGTEAQISAGDLGAGSYFLTRTAGRDYLGGPADVATRSLALLALAESGVLRSYIGGRYSLEDANQALDDLESRATTGKLLLIP